MDYTCMILGCWSMVGVGAPESADLYSRAPDYWIHHMGRDRAISAALQLQHDPGLIMSNLQVLYHEPFPSATVQFVAPSHRIRSIVAE